MEQVAADVSEYLVVNSWEVVSYLKEGYKLYGQPMCIKHPDFSEILFFQAMVR